MICEELHPIVQLPCIKHNGNYHQAEKKIEGGTYPHTWVYLWPLKLEFVQGAESAANLMTWEELLLMDKEMENHYTNVIKIRSTVQE